MSEIKSSNKNKSESTSLQKRNTPVSSLKLIQIETQKNSDNEKENKQLPNSTGDKNRKDERKMSVGQGHVLKERKRRNQEQDEGKVKIIIDELLKQKMSPKLLLERMQLSEICCQKSVQFIRKLMLETRSSKKRRKMAELIQILDYTKQSLNISKQERSTIGQNLKKLEKRMYILTLHIRRQNKFIESLESRVKQAKTWDKYLESEKKFFEGANAYIETEQKDFRLVDFSEQWNLEQSRKYNIFSERHIKLGSQSSEEESVRSQENLSPKESLRLRPEVYNIHLSSNRAQPRNNSQEQISSIVHELRRMNRSLEEHLQPQRLSRLNQSPIVQLRQQQRQQNIRLGHQQSIAEQIDLISDPPVIRS